MTTSKDLIATLTNIVWPHHLTTWRRQWIEREGITTIDELWDVGRGEFLMRIANECGVMPSPLWMARNIAIPEARKAAAMLEAHGCVSPAPLVQALADATTDEEAVLALVGIAGTPSVTDGLMLLATPMWGEVETPEQESLLAAIDAWGNMRHIASGSSGSMDPTSWDTPIKRADRARGTDAVRSLWPVPPAKVAARFAA